MKPNQWSNCQNYIGLSIAVVLSFSLFACGGGGTSSMPVTSTSPESILYNFGAPHSGDAYGPSADLVIDSTGNLYGTSFNGGANNTGAVFKISPTGNEAILHSFGPAGTTSDGTGPLSLALDGSGNLYGTTQNGGSNGSGTVFKISSSGNETILYSFSQGTLIYGRRLTIDSYGNLFLAIAGNTNGGTSAFGEVLKITPSGTLSTLANFNSMGSEARPNTGVVMDGNGNLYGAADVSNLANGYGLCGIGSVESSFKVAPSGAISPVCGPNSYSGFPALSEPMIDSSGNIYVTSSNSNGAIYKITPSLAVFTLYSFSGDKNSSNTIYHSDLAIDSSGNLYGTTSNDGVNGVGSVFKLTPAGAESTIYSFKNSGDGAFPMAGLVMDSSGNLYGTTSLGGTNGGGTVFKITNP